MKTAREIIAGALDYETIGDGRKDTFERTVDAILAALAAEGFSIVETGRDPGADARKFTIGDRVTKVKGSRWTGHVVGFYSTKLTPVGYAVESETETGSVQIYPEAALSRSTREGKTG
jgi:hypothetical protein